jgi:hypothetical protein
MRAFLNLSTTVEFATIVAKPVAKPEPVRRPLVNYLDSGSPREDLTHGRVAH